MKSSKLLSLGSLCWLAAGFVVATIATKPIEIKTLEGLIVFLSISAILALNAIAWRDGAK